MMLEKAKPIASGLLEPAESDVAYENGNFLVVGTDRRVSLFEVAARAKATGQIFDTKATSTRGRSRTAAMLPRSRSIPVPARSRSSPVPRSVTAARCSIPRSEGQLVGGVAQGLGQALKEMPL